MATPFGPPSSLATVSTCPPPRERPSSSFLMSTNSNDPSAIATGPSGKPRFPTSTVRARSIASAFQTEWLGRQAHCQATAVRTLQLTRKSTHHDDVNDYPQG